MEERREYRRVCASDCRCLCVRRLSVGSTLLREHSLAHGDNAAIFESRVILSGDRGQFELEMPEARSWEGAWKGEF